MLRHTIFTYSLVHEPLPWDRGFADVLFVTIDGFQVGVSTLYMPKNH